MVFEDTFLLISASTFHFRDLDTHGKEKAWGSQYTFTARQTRSSAVSVRFLPEYSTTSTWVEPSGGITFIFGRPREQTPEGFRITSWAFRNAIICFV